MYSAEEMKKILEASIQPKLPNRKDYRIGCIGSGFIMRDCHLTAYRNAGFSPVMIASRTKSHAQEVADRHQIPMVYDDWHDLVRDPELEILDIAYPPDQQPEIVREAVKNPSLKGILCQKPIAMDLKGAREIADLGDQYGKKIAVNSNMRYDQSMRALKKLIDMGELGEIVIATIEMRAIPHWQTFLAEYDKLEIFGMGIHHVDSFRYLLGDPDEITCVCRKDPRTKFDHVDGITQYTFHYENGPIATSLDDVWAWPEDPCAKDIYIKWRVEGTNGLAEGTIGWPKYPEAVPSTLRFASKNYPGIWITPTWEKVWFPDAFEGTMASLLCAVEDDTEPEISARDNIKTIACVEACYQSIKEKRTVTLQEILN